MPTFDDPEFDRHILTRRAVPVDEQALDVIERGADLLAERILEFADKPRMRTKFGHGNESLSLTQRRGGRAPRRSDSLADKPDRSSPGRLAGCRRRSWSRQ